MSSSVVNARSIKRAGISVIKRGDTATKRRLTAIGGLEAREDALKVGEDLQRAWPRLRHIELLSMKGFGLHDEDDAVLVDQDLRLGGDVVQPLVRVCRGDRRRCWRSIDVAVGRKRRRSVVHLRRWGLERRSTVSLLNRMGWERWLRLRLRLLLRRRWVLRWVLRSGRLSTEHVAGVTLLHRRRVGTL